MEQQNLFQNGTPKIEVPLETILTRQVKALYLNKGHQLGIPYPQNPFATFNRAWFRECFAVVAHRHGLFYYQGKLASDLGAVEAESRAQYGRYFQIVARRLCRALKRLNKNSAEVPPICRDLFTRESHFPPDDPFDQPGSRRKSTRPPEVGARLAQIKKELLKLQEERRIP